MALAEVVYVPIALRVVLYMLMGLCTLVAIRIGRSRRLTVEEFVVVVAVVAVLFLLTLPSVTGHGHWR